MAKNMEISLLFDFYGDMLTDKQRDVVELYYNDDLSLAEIAENQGITRQGVRDSIKRAESQLWNMEERLGLAKRFRRMKEELETVYQAAQDIQKINRQGAVSHEIEQHANTIMKLTAQLSEQ